MPDLEEKVRDSGWVSSARGFVAKTKGPDLILNVLGTTGRFKRGVLQRNDLIWLWERWFWLLSGEQTWGVCQEWKQGSRKRAPGDPAQGQVMAAGTGMGAEWSNLLPACFVHAGGGGGGGSGGVSVCASPALIWL